MRSFDVFALHGPYGIENTWSSGDVDKNSPCGWLHSLANTNIIGLTSDHAFSVKLADFSSATALCSRSRSLLNILSAHIAQPEDTKENSSSISGTDGGQTAETSEKKDALDDQEGKPSDTMPPKVNMKHPKPLLIVAHGLAGVILKQAMLIAIKEAQYLPIALRTCRLVFFGCPHRISANDWDEVLRKIAISYAKNPEPPRQKRSFLDIDAVEAISDEFLTFAAAYRIVSFYEASAGSVTISEQSATMGIHSEIAIPLDASFPSLAKIPASGELFDKVATPLTKVTSFEERSKPEFIQALQTVLRLGGLLHPPESQLMHWNPGTLEWLKADARYKSWSSNEGTTILHIHGRIGCGKSTILRYIANLLRTAPKEIVVFAYSFDAYHARGSVRRFLLDFVAQLLFYLPNLFSHSVQEIISGVEIWTTELLWRIFLKIVTHSKRADVICLVDDLDECYYLREKILPKILATKDEYRGNPCNEPVPRFQFVIASRDCGQQRQMAGDTGKEHKVPQFHTCIDLNVSQELVEDRHRIVGAWITELLDNKPVLAPYQAEIIKKLSGPEITILQANLHKIILESYILDSTPNCIRRELQAMPRTLEQCYNTILGRVPIDRREWTQVAFSWMFNAIRTLTQVELSTALAIDSTTGTFDEGDISGDIISDLKSVVGPVATASGDEVDFSHGSVRHFIEFRGSKLIKTWGNPTFGDDKVTLCCLSYLTKKIPHMHKSGKEYIRYTVDGASWLDDSDEGMGFMGYAVTNWAKHHLRTLESDSIDTKTVLEFMGNQEVFMTWVQTYSALQQGSILQLPSDTSQTRSKFLFLAENGLEDVLSRLLGSKNKETVLRETDEKEFAIALELAAQEGHVKVVKRLLECGIADDTVLKATKTIARRTTIDGVFPALVTYARTKELVNADNLKFLLCSSAETGHIEGFSMLLADVDKYMPVWEDNESTPLHLAAALGHESIVRRIFDKPGFISPNAGLRKEELDHNITGTYSYYSSEQSWLTPLHVAARNGHCDIVTILIENGADVAATTSFGLTPLHFASLTGYAKVAELLIKAGADVNFKGIGAGVNIPLFYAAREGHSQVVKLLLEHGAKRKDFETNSSTPLHWAAQYGKRECVRLLLLAGSDKDHPDQGGLTPLHLAVRGNYVDVVELLLSHGVDVDTKKGREGTAGSPLSYAIEGNHVKIVELLLKAGASTTLRQNYGGKVLNFAAIQGNVDCVDLLLKHRADINVADNYGDSPLHDAVNFGRNSESQKKHIKVVERLIQGGATVEAAGNSGLRPLHYADYSPEITQILLNAGASIEVENDYGDTPLIRAAKNGNSKVVELLLRKGASPNHVTTAGSPLYHAVWYGKVETVRLLLDKGADCFAKYNDESVLEYARSGSKNEILELMFRHLLKKDEKKHLHNAVKRSQKNPELVSALLSYSNGGKGNVDINRRNRHGRTAIFYAASGGYKEAMRLLLEEKPDTSLRDCDGRLARDVVSTLAVRDLLYNYENPKEKLSAGTGAEEKESKGTAPIPAGMNFDLDPSTCRFTNHDGNSDQTSWKYFWCDTCYDNIYGFFYHCCNCANDNYKICQECFEKRDRRCPGNSSASAGGGQQHSYRKRFTSRKLFSFEEYCSWVAKLERPRQISREDWTAETKDPDVEEKAELKTTPDKTPIPPLSNEDQPAVDAVELPKENLVEVVEQDNDGKSKGNGEQGTTNEPEAPATEGIAGTERAPEGNTENGNPEAEEAKTEEPQTDEPNAEEPRTDEPAPTSPTFNYPPRRLRPFSRPSPATGRWVLRWDADDDSDADDI